MPSIKLTEDAKRVLYDYKWPGNIRQLKNITEQLSVVAESREISADMIRNLIPNFNSVTLPALADKESDSSFSSEREIMYKILFDMRKDMNQLKKLVLEIINDRESGTAEIMQNNEEIINKIAEDTNYASIGQDENRYIIPKEKSNHIQDTEEIVEESLSLEEKEIELITKALNKCDGKRKAAADELGISERTLYRKIKEYGLQ